jgi:aryl sulfotransferase
LVGKPCPRCPEDIHAFWQSWISRGWFDWEQEGYPFWENMHHTQTWWNCRHLDNIQFFHYADLLANSTGEIKRIAEFLGIDVSIRYCSGHQSACYATKKTRGWIPPALQRGR